MPAPTQKLINAVQALFGSAFAISRGYSDDHDAVDIKASRGTPLRTIDNGKVSYARDARTDSEEHRLKHWAKGGGNVVNIDIGNNRTIQYAHLNRIDVKEGDTVAAGQLIGTVGSTGNATGPHVHFGLWHHGVGMIEPTSYLAALAGQAPAGATSAVAVPTAKINVIERYDPPRHFTVPAGSTIRGYDPARPGTVITDADFPQESGASALAQVVISWPGLDPEPVPHGTFFLVADGLFARQYIKVQSVVLDPAAGPASWCQPCPSLRRPRRRSPLSSSGTRPAISRSRQGRRSAASTRLGRGRSSVSPRSPTDRGHTRRRWWSSPGPISTPSRSRTGRSSRWPPGSSTGCTSRLRALSSIR